MFQIFKQRLSLPPFSVLLPFSEGELAKEPRRANVYLLPHMAILVALRICIFSFSFSIVLHHKKTNKQTFFYLGFSSVWVNTVVFPYFHSLYTL